MNRSVWLNWFRKNILTILTCAFLVASFLPLRKIMNYTEASRYGWYVEQLAISVYLADIIFIFLLGFIIYQCFIASPSKITIHALFAERSDLIITSAIFIYFIAEASRNVSISLGIYSLARLMQFFVLLLIVPYLLKNKVSLRQICVLLVMLGLIQSLFGLLQVTNGHSLGLRYIGEQTISTTMPGVAKVTLDAGQRLLRAYGTMPHPNILGGFLVLCLGASIYLVKSAPKWRVWSYFASVFIFVGLLLTFSRSALLSALILGLILAQFRWNNITKRVVAFSIATLVTLFLLILTSNSAFRTALWNRVIPPPSDAFFNDRVLLIDNSVTVFRANILIGTGLGNYLPKLFNEFPVGSKLQKWHYDYPHNIIIILHTELGILGTIIFCYFLLTFLQSGGLKNRQIVSIIIILSPIILFDHYLWTNQIGRIIFILFIALCSQILDQAEEMRNEKTHKSL